MQTPHREVPALPAAPSCHPIIHPLHPSYSHPVDLVPGSAVLHLLYFDIGQALVTAVAALAGSRPRAVFLAHHSGILERLLASVILIFLIH